MPESANQDRLLLINKPLNWTSFDVVNKLRRIFNMKKIGHAGTLDPLATGLLIICTGKFTKKIESFMGLEKEYTGTLVLGQTTPSHDLETEPTPAVSVTHLTNELIVGATTDFLGQIEQMPPQHSAIKIGGKKAYQFARKGKEAKLNARLVDIKEFEITEVKLPEVKFRVICSKGTYIRALARDFGEKLGVGAYLSQLCRTRIGPYRLDEAQELAEVQP
jgi:tRNA pseudouridine55 synthase